ncbi:MAG: polysaccharide biosynthesis/export family protein, partial [Cyanobacteria bacterium J06632_22]
MTQAIFFQNGSMSFLSPSRQNFSHGCWSGLWTGLILLIGAFPVRADLPPLAPAVRASDGAATVASQRPVSLDYRLGSGDRIEVEVFNVPNYTGSFEVLSDGSLQLPLVGRVTVAGLTLTEATTTISRAYGEYIRQPYV